MKRSLRLTLTLIAVLVLAMSVMVISAGAAEGPNADIVSGTITPFAGGDAIPVTNGNIASPLSMNLGSTFESTYTLGTFSSTNTSFTFVSASAVVTDASTSGTTTVKVTVNWSTNSGADTAKTEILLTLYVNDIASFSTKAGQDGTIAPETNTMTFTAATATNVNLLQYVSTSSSTSIFGVTPSYNYIGTIDPTTGLYTYGYSATKDASIGYITATVTGYKNGIPSQTIGTFNFIITPPTVNPLTKFEFDGSDIFFMTGSVNYSPNSMTVNKQTLISKFSFNADTYSNLAGKYQVEGIYTNSSFASNTAIGDTYTLRSSTDTLYAKITYGWPYTEAGGSHAVTINVKGSTGTPSFSSYASNNNTAIDPTNGTISISPTSATNVDLEQYLSIPTGASASYSVQNGVGSIVNINDYQYKYNATKDASIGKVNVDVTYYVDGVSQTKSFIFTITPPTLSSSLKFTSTTATTITGNTTVAYNAGNNSSVTKDTLTNAFTQTPTAAYTITLYTNSGKTTEMGTSTSLNTIYAEVTTKWPYHVSSAEYTVTINITYAISDDTVKLQGGGTSLSISPTSATSVNLSQYITSSSSDITYSVNKGSTYVSNGNTYYTYYYGTTQANSVGTVTATVRGYKNGTYQEIAKYTITITPPAISSNLYFNGSALSVSGSTASAAYSTSSSSITRSNLGNLFTSSPSGSYSLSGIYTTAAGNTLIDNTYSISGTSYVYARLTTNWPYTTSSNTVTVTLTIKSTADTYTPKNETNKVTVAKGAAHSFTIAEMLTNYINTNFYNSNKTTSNYEFKITGVGSTYGQAYYKTSNGSTKTKLTTSTTLSYSQISNGYFTYDADDASGTKYDTITFSILYNNTVIHSGLKMNVYVGDGDGTYTAESFSLSYKSSASSVSFTKNNFTSHYVTSSGSTSNVPDIDYVVFTSLPATKYGVLYNGSERSSNEVGTSDKIDYSDLGNLQFVFGNSFSDGVTLKYYIVDVNGNKSGTATITITNKNTPPVVYDYAVGVLSNKTYTFDKSDFTKAYFDANGDSLSSIKITSLPSEGTLYLSNSKVSVGETISASNLGKLKYEPDGSNYRDSFSWQAYDGASYSAMSANMQIIVFRSSISSIGGDMTVYLENKEYSFSYDDFERVYVTDDSSKYPLTKIEITSLPSDGTLYLGSEKSSNAVKKGDELTKANMNSLIYVADSGFKKEDDFEYIVYDGNSWSSSSNYGAVTIKAGYDTPTGGYNYTKSGSTMSLTFDSQAPSSGKVTGTLTESDITALIKEANTGSTLIVYIPSSQTAETRALVIDDSLFTVDNVKIISKIRLMDTDSTSGSAGYVELDTAAVSAQYSRSTADFTLSLTSVTPSNALNSLYSAGSMRTVDMKIGSTSITGFNSAGSAIIALPYPAASSQSDMAVILRAGTASSSSAAPVVSSKYYSSLSQLTADISLLGSGTYLSGTNVKSFSDMYSSLWDYSYVMNLASRNVIDGYPQGTYLNNKDVKRSEYIKLLVESFGLYNAGASCQFTDLPSYAWYYTYVASAVKSGILTDGGAFNGDDPITRDDMALYSYRAAMAAGINLSTNRTASTFTDQNAIGSVYTAAIQALQRAGIIDGYTNGSFLPKGTTDRGEAAKVIRLLLDQYYIYN